MKRYPLTWVWLARLTLDSFYKFKSVLSKFKFRLQKTSIRKIKYKSTPSHNKICSGMNATKNFISLPKTGRYRPKPNLNPFSGFYLSVAI
jgi:hypothetical protein